MIPKVDSGWLKIFEQKGWIYLVLALFFAAPRYLLYYDLLVSLDRYDWLVDVSLLGAILFSLLAVGSFVQWFVSRANNYLLRRQARKTVLSRLETLSGIEHRILSYLIQANEQSFNYRIDDGDLQQLVHKGLLRMAGGHQNMLAIPFMVPDIVWSELKRRKDEFGSAAPPADPPWIKSWMAY